MKILNHVPLSWRTPALAYGLMALMLIGCDRGAPRPEFVRQTKWMDSGVWMKVDTHIHTTFSDGAHSVSVVAAKAREFGCDAIAITDHGDQNLKGASLEYAEAIEVARREHPELLILAGLEWNVPPWKGETHATVLMPGGPDEFLHLADFKSQFDDFERTDRTEHRAEQAIRWLESVETADDSNPVVILNHPSRKTESASEAGQQFQTMLDDSVVTIGYEGAPGHQKGKQLGAYKGPVMLMDRWDPVAAEVGGIWDQQLGSGSDVWAALATSDFHNDQDDYWPGEFSETWVYAPERTSAGVLSALRAGSFFGSHGGIVRELEISVAADGLERTARAGESISATSETPLTVSVSGVVSAMNLLGQPGGVNTIELMVTDSAGTQIVTLPGPFAGRFNVDHRIILPRDGIVIRARGRQIASHAPDLLFYTNPVRVLDAVAQPATIELAKELVTRYSWRGLVGGALLIWVIGALVAQVASGLRRSVIRDRKHDLPAPRQVARPSQLSRLKATLQRGCSIPGAMVSGSTASPLRENSVADLKALSHASRCTYGAYAGLVVAAAVWYTMGAATAVPFHGASSLGWIREGWTPGMIAKLVWCLGLLGLLVVPLYPPTGVLIYVAAMYGFQRFHPELEYMLTHGFPELICGFSVLGCAVHVKIRKHCASAPVIWSVIVMTAMAVWGMVSTGWSLLHDGAWPFELIHHPVRLVENLALFLIAGFFIGGRRDLIWMALVFIGTLTVRSMTTANLTGEHDLAGLIAIALPLGIGMIRIAPHWVTKVVLLLMSLNLGRVLWESQNRGAGLGLLAGLCALWIMSLRKRRYILLGIPLALTVWMVIQSTPYGKRFIDAWESGITSGSGASRIALWEASAGMIRDHWVLGVGPGNSAEMIVGYSSRSTGKALHNNFVSVLAEQGVVGLSLYVTLFAGSVLTLWRVGCLWPREWLAPEARAVCAALIAYLIVGMFITRHDLAMAFILAGIGAAIATQPAAHTRRFVLVRDKATPRSDPPAKSIDVTEEPERQMSLARFFSAIAGMFTAFLVYGSLVPFAFHSVSLADAIDQFQSLHFTSSFTEGRLDWSLNFMLTIPIAGFGLGALVAERSNQQYLPPMALLAFSGCVLLSVAVEFSQIWFVGRIPSGLDIAAQVAGAGTGVGLWLLAGRPFSHWLRSFFGLRQPAARIEWLLQAYVLGLLVYSIFPMDFILTAGELFEKFRLGKIELIPFTHVYESTSLMLYSLFTEVILFVPVGMCVASAWNRKSQRLRPMQECFLIGALLVTAIEILQLFVFSRFTSSTDLISGMAGVGLGGFAMYVWRQESVVRTRPDPDVAPSAAWWVTGAIVYSIFLAAVFWAPFEFSTDPAFIKSRIGSFIAVPFSRMQAGSDIAGIIGILRKTLWFAPLGVLIANAVRRVQHPTGRKWAVALSCLFIATIAVAVEAGQILLPRAVADMTDALLFAGSGMAAVAITLRVYRSDNRPRESVRSAIDNPGHGRETIGGLDGLRALACLAVFGVHFQQMTNIDGQWGPFDLSRLLLNGNTGVVLFFILSGFLLSIPLWSNPPSTRANATLRNYVSKRLSRIVPAYYLCLTVLVVGRQHWASTAQFQDSCLHYLFLNNWTDATFYSINSPFWTIAEQAQFYLVFAVLVGLAARLRWLTDTRLLTLFSVTCLTSFVAHVLVVTIMEHSAARSSGPAVNRSILAHLPIFLLGVLTAWLFVNQRRFLPGPKHWCWDIVLLLSAIVMVAILATPLDDLFQIPHGRYHLPYVPLLVALTILAVPLSTIGMRILEFAPFRLLGVISYGIYVYHLPCLGLTSRLMTYWGIEPRQFLLVFAAVGLTLSIATATLSYVLVERVIIAYLKTSSRPLVARPS